ncbi:hypothetical protein [Macrococcoides caseolyticum]|uniref:hypothetical protein n=1 Tax=Macrococcoides caseolyticum TaxID=69966 RepID=UPI001F461D30|nr:hypothetical protein [Macrococcus caseolyticus]MCE4957163.1 hypothetical protein [Macrococcus caseolyticus]
MTLTISKEFLMYLLLFIVITVFGLLYMTQAEYIYNQTSSLTEQVGEQHSNTVHQTQVVHDPVQNGEVLGVVN